MYVRRRALGRFVAAATAVSIIAIGAVVVASQATYRTLGGQPSGAYLVSTNQIITPVGRVERLEGARPKDIALSPDGRTLAVLATNRVALFGADGEPRGQVAMGGGPLGVAWSPAGDTLYVTAGNGRVSLLSDRDGAWKSVGTLAVEPAGARPPRGQPANPQPTGIAVAPDGKRIYVALSVRNAVAELDVAGLAVTRTFPVGVCPYRILLSPDGGMLYVANRGGAVPPAEADGTELSAGTPVRVDRRTDAALRGSLSVVNLATGASTDVPVGRQPSGLTLSRDGRTLYVANSDGDDLSLVDTASRRETGRLALRPPRDPGFGQMPTAVALSADGRRLWVACGGANAVAAVDLAPGPRVAGWFAAGWYPVAVAAGGDGRLYVASTKGIGARPAGRTGGLGVHDSVGTVQFVAPGDLADIAAQTRRVATNNRWRPTLQARRGRKPVPVPERVGEPSVFRHVVYIIKENHTYDSTLGDMPEGNGDASLTLFGERITPNHHALAREFVLLDNTYTSGTNSADGHQWTSSSVANGYMEQNYSANVRSYPYNGGDPLAYSPAGFLWNAAAAKGVSVRVYGEFVNRPRIVGPDPGRRPTWKELWDDYRSGAGRYQITADTDNVALRPFLHPRFIGFPSIVSDQWRADQFLADLNAFEKSGTMPSLCILLLPNNHTSGTSPGMPTPRAAVADNDLAMGRIVDRISHSRFWRETLILIIEDDSQLGLDHVDGHRTLAFCVSPYTRRGAVVHEPYNHTSLVRTMGLVLGLPPMNRFDRTGQPMTACFANRPDWRPFVHRPARVRLDELNPPARALKGERLRLALASLRQDWSDVDRVNPTVVARAVWSACRPAEPFPWRKFDPPAEPDGDD